MIKRMDERLVRVDAALDRNAAAFDRNSDIIERMDAIIEDGREFMRQLTLRHERAERRTARELAELTRKTDVQVAQMNDLLEESRAQRQGLLALIDKLGPAT